MHVIETFPHIEYGFTASAGFKFGYIKAIPNLRRNHYRVFDIVDFMPEAYSTRDYTQRQLAVTHCS